jgi:hypothetical protein
VFPHGKSCNLFLENTANTVFVVDYMKQVKAGLKEKGASDDEIKQFETGAQAFAKKIVSNFKDYEFLIGESMNPDGMSVYSSSSVSYFH